MTNTIKTVLVTGGTGFVGSHVARQLLQSGHKVRLLVRDLEKARAIYQSLPGLNNNSEPEFFCGDITDSQNVSDAMQGCQSVVHAAAGTPIALPSLDELYAVNVGGTKNVIDAALEAKLDSIVYISSATTIFNPDANKIDVNAALVMPRMPYGRSKAEAENYVRSRQSANTNISIVYPSGIIGPDDPGFSDAFKALHHRINNGYRMFDSGGIQQIDVRDLAAFICSLATDGGQGRFIVVGKYLEWAGQADIIEKVSGAKLQRMAVKGWKMRLIGRLMDVMRLIKKIDSPVSAETMRYATLWPQMANTDELRKRNITLREPEASLADSMAWMLAAGYLTQEQVPKLSRRENKL